MYFTYAEMMQVMPFIKIHSNWKSYFPYSEESCSNSDIIFINQEFKTRICVIFKMSSTLKFISNVQLELNYRS